MLTRTARFICAVWVCVDAGVAGGASSMGSTTDFTVSATVDVKSAKFTGSRTLTGQARGAAITANSLLIHALGPNFVGDWSLHATSLLGVSSHQAVKTSKTLWVTYYDTPAGVALIANHSECTVTFDRLDPAGGVSGTFDCKKPDGSATFAGTFSATAQTGPLPPGPTSPSDANHFKLASVPTPTSTEYQKLAADLKKKHLAQESPDVQSKLNTALSTLDAQNAKAAVYASLGAVVGPLKDPVGGIVIAAHAAVRFPTDVLVANNLGSLLHAHNEMRPAAQVLLYAVSLAKQPVILGNLGSVAVDVGDYPAAETLLAQAGNGGDCHSWKELAILYLREQRVGQALDALHNSMPCNSTFKDEKNIDKAEAGQGDDTEPPPPPTWPPPQGAGGNGGATAADIPSPAATRLSFPPFPNWADVDTLGAYAMHDPPMVKQISKLGTTAATDYVNGVAGYKGKDATGPSGGLRITQERNIIAVEMASRFYAYQLTHLAKEHGKRQVAIDKRYTDQLRQIAQAQHDGIKRDGIDTEAQGASANAFCKQRHALTDKWFGEWRDEDRDYYDGVVKILKQAYQVTDGWVASAHDGGLRSGLEGQRQMLINLGFTPFFVEAKGRPIVFATAQMTPNADWKCTEPPPPPVTTSGASMKDPAKQDEIPCPFQGSSFSFGVEVPGLSCKIKIEGCDEVKLEGFYGEGIGAAASVSFNLKEHEVTLFAGVGAKTDYDTLYGTVLGGEAKAGLYMTLGANGVSDWGGMASVELGADSEGVGSQLTVQGKISGVRVLSDLMN